MTEDTGALEQRADEAIREQRWTEFVVAVKDYQRGMKWSTVLVDVCDAMDGYLPDPFGEYCVNFAETEGWHGVLTAIGRAMREDAK